MGDSCCGVPKQCDPKEHSGHLCVLASEKAFDKIKQLAHNAQYICFTCGRVSASHKNLCNPMPIA